MWSSGFRTKAVKKAPRRPAEDQISAVHRCTCIWTIKMVDRWMQRGTGAEITPLGIHIWQIPCWSGRGVLNILSIPGSRSRTLGRAEKAPQSQNAQIRGSEERGQTVELRYGPPPRAKLRPPPQLEWQSWCSEVCLEVRRATFVIRHESTKTE